MGHTAQAAAAEPLYHSCVRSATAIIVGFNTVGSCGKVVAHQPYVMGTVAVASAAPQRRSFYKRGSWRAVPVGGYRPEPAGGKPFTPFGSPLRAHAHANACGTTFVMTANSVCLAADAAVPKAPHIAGERLASSPRSFLAHTLTETRTACFRGARHYRSLCKQWRHDVAFSKPFRASPR